MVVRWFGIIFVLLVLSFSTAIQSSAQQVRTERSRLDLGYGASIRYLPNWSLAETHFENAFALVGSPDRAGGTPARTLITVERQKDHSITVRRLADIAVEATMAHRYRTIGGWPAVERRYLAPPSEPVTKKTEELVLHLTTAIAAGDLLIRLETTMRGPTRSSFSQPPERRLADQALAIGRSLVFPIRGGAEEVRKEVELLRKTSPERSRMRRAAQ